MKNPKNIAEWTANQVNQSLGSHPFQRRAKQKRENRFAAKPTLFAPIMVIMNQLFSGDPSWWNGGFLQLHHNLVAVDLHW